MVNAFFVSDLKDSNGKTIRENNLEKKHLIPIGTLVEVNCDYLSEHQTRQFIASHTRDCDGSPMYAITPDRNLCEDRIRFNERGAENSKEFIDLARKVYHNNGWSSDSLVVVGEPSTRFSVLVELETEEMIQQAITLYHYLDVEDGVDLNFHVKFSDDRDNLIIYNDVGVTNQDMLCKYLLDLGRELGLEGILAITYSRITSIEVLEENGGGVFFADFDEDHVHHIDLKDAIRTLSHSVNSYMLYALSSKVYS